MSKDMLLDITDGIAVITFNRPEAMNTFSQSMMEELGDAYRRCDEDDSIRAVVVTGSGKAFCAGAELQSDGDTFNTGGVADFSSCPLSFQAWDVRKPVIAACNGHAIGVGLGIAAQCDLRVFAVAGKYGFLQNRRGAVADFAIGYTLPKLIGFERAFEMLVGAGRITGEQAGEWGLASRVVPAEQVLETAMAIASDMAKNCSPLVMGLHKKLMWDGLDQTREQFIEQETKALHCSLAGPDATEGGMAYFERREPNWQSSISKDWPDIF
ncbi:MAG: enoyl-CoA hydratase-related protein [Halioglobus sp.]